MIQLSIIIVNYKSWKILQKCLDSFEQFPPKLDYEIVVVDNDSRDGEFESFSKKNTNIKFIQNSGNNGFSNGCNLGAKNANGEYLLFLNPDTELIDNSAIDNLVQYAKNHSNNGITACATQDHSDKDNTVTGISNPWLLINWIKAIYKIAYKNKIKNQLNTSNGICHPKFVSGCNILIKNTIFNQIGRWDDSAYWMYYEDNDLCRKIKDAGLEITLLEDTYIRHIGGGASNGYEELQALLKAEYHISAHNYIRSYTSGLSNIVLHTMYILKVIVSRGIKILIAIFFLKKKKYKFNTSILQKMLKYYFVALKNNSWENPRLK